MCALESWLLLFFSTNNAANNELIQIHKGRGPGTLTRAAHESGPWRMSTWLTWRGPQTQNFHTLRCPIPFHYYHSWPQYPKFPVLCKISNKCEAKCECKQMLNMQNCRGPWTYCSYGTWIIPPLTPLLFEFVCLPWPEVGRRYALLSDKPFIIVNLLCFIIVLT